MVSSTDGILQVIEPLATICFLHSHATILYKILTKHILYSYVHTTNASILFMKVLCVTTRIINCLIITLRTEGGVDNDLVDGVRNAAVAGSRPVRFVCEPFLGSGLIGTE